MNEELCGHHEAFIKGITEGFKSGLEEGIKLNNKWVSVKDKLPLYKQVVLVFLDTKQITEAVYRGEYDKDEHIFRIELTREDTGEIVTHWMPLLNPPENKE